jgi:hypothetical protein
VNDETYELVRKVWNHIAAHAVYEAVFVFPFHFVVSGPDGMILVMQYQSLDQPPKLLLQHFPMSEAQMSLPQNISVFCRELASVHVRIVVDKQTKQPKPIWETSGKRRSGQPTMQFKGDGMELSRGRAAFAGGRD